MEYCDFASITKIIRDDLLEGSFINQVNFVTNLFDSYVREKKVAFDNGLVCRWLSGTARVSLAIRQFYQKSKKNRTYLAETLEDAIFPCLPDRSMTVQKIYELFVRDEETSEDKINELSNLYSTRNASYQAEFVAEVLVYGMTRRYISRDIREPNQMTAGNRSPVLYGFVYDEGIPNPCPHFCGREKELSLLHEKLTEAGKLFIRGIPGIGKSELARAYAKEHRSDYTNILYFTYTGSLMQDIANLVFSNDSLTSSMEDRFRAHNRFLQTMKPDTLLIIDNFNTTAEKDDILHVVMGYRCRVLFTTRSRMDGYSSFCLEEISDPEVLFQLAAQFYSRAEQNREMLKFIIQLVHGHTFAVELAARLLETGILTPQELFRKLLEEKTGLDDSDEINAFKDGKSQRATYSRHIHTLFALFRLSKAQKNIMCNMALIPLTGIGAQLLGKWMKLRNLNKVKDLVELGFIHTEPGYQISLHPMIQEVAVSDLHPSTENCAIMLESIRATCQLHGEDVTYHQIMFQTVENAVKLLRKDDIRVYIRLLEDVFAYMDNYSYESGMRLLADELGRVLDDPDVGISSDRAVLLSYRAQLLKTPWQAISLLKQALALLPEVNAGNALLVSNLNSNLSGRYFETMQFEAARDYLETAIDILDQYGLIGYHDSVVQLYNYALLLASLDNKEEALRILNRLCSVLRDNHLEQGPDYAAAQEQMGMIFLNLGDIQEAEAHHRKSMEIYEVIYASEPQLIEQKKREWQQECIQASLRLGGQISKKTKNE